MIYRTLVSPTGGRCEHVVGCRARRVAALIDGTDAESERFAGLLDDLELQLRVRLWTSPLESQTPVGEGSYVALLDDLGLDGGLPDHFMPTLTPANVQLAPVSGDGAYVRLRAGDFEILLVRHALGRERVAVIDGRPVGEGPWDCAVVAVGDVIIEVRAAPGDAAEVVYILPDRVIVADAARFADQLLRQSPELAAAMGFRAQTLLSGSAGLRTALPLVRNPAPVKRQASRGEADVVKETATEARWRDLGTPHPDGYRQLHPAEALPWIERFLVVEPPGRHDRRHIPGAIAADITDPAVLSRVLAPIARTGAVLVVSEYGFDCRRFARRLVQDGFERVFHLKGGLHRWRLNELPTSLTARQLSALELVTPATVP